MQKITKMKRFENGQNVMFPLSLLLIFSLWILIYVMPSVKTPWMSQNAKLCFWSHFKTKSEFYPELFKFCLYDIHI